MPMLRRRRPLLRAAGAAAVGSAAYHAGRRRGEEGQYAQEPHQAPESYPPPGPPRGGLTPEAVNALAELGRLHEQGVLTDQEFEQQKQRYLQG
jgi:hypothetical protein